MVKKFLCIFLAGILLYGLYRYAVMSENKFIKDTENAVTEIVFQSREETDTKLHDAIELLGIYRPILEEYDRMWQDETYTKEKRNYVCETVDKYREQNEKYLLQYSFTDIADDGIEELVIGVCNIEKQEYSQLAIYSYQNGGIHMVLEGAGYDMSIHEGGFVELYDVCDSECNYTYYLLDSYFGLANFWGQLVVAKSGNSEKTYFYQYYSIRVPIEKEEFQAYKNMFMEAPIELEWKPLEGFWNSGNLLEENQFKAEGTDAIWDVYQSILTEYDRLWKDNTYTWEKCKYASQSVLDYKENSENYPLVYSLVDIADDSIEELIIGIYDIEEQKYEPMVIYTYDGRIHMDFERPRYIVSVSIYEGGIVEAYGEIGLETYYIYLLYNKGSVFAEGLGQFVVDDIQSKYGETTYFFESYSVKIQISEKEFQQFKNIYTGIPIEFEWKPLKGFWNKIQ